MIHDDGCTPKHVGSLLNKIIFLMAYFVGISCDIRTRSHIFMFYRCWYIHYVNERCCFVKKVVLTSFFVPAYCQCFQIREFRHTAQACTGLLCSSDRVGC